MSAPRSWSVRAIPGESWRYSVSTYGSSPREMDRHTAFGVLMSGTPMHNNDVQRLLEAAEQLAGLTLTVS